MALNMEKKTLQQILLVFGMLFGFLIFGSLPYQNVIQIFLFFSFFVLYEIILGILVLYTFDITKLIEYSQNHPSVKTGIILVSFRLHRK